MWEKEKMLVTSNFSFTHSVFKSLVMQTRKYQGLFGKGLTHYQMTNFRQFQIERVCRRQFQIWRKRQKIIKTDRKHWKKEKLLVTSNFSFSHSVFKELVSQGRQKASLCGNGLNSSDISPYLNKSSYWSCFAGYNGVKNVWQLISI